MDGERMLTVKQVAERLGANPVTIQRWLRSGRLRGVQPGGTKLGWRIPESEVERLLLVGFVRSEMPQEIEDVPFHLPGSMAREAGEGGTEK